MRNKSVLASVGGRPARAAITAGSVPPPTNGPAASETATAPCRDSAEGAAALFLPPPGAGVERVISHVFEERQARLSENDEPGTV